MCLVRGPVVQKRGRQHIWVKHRGVCILFHIMQGHVAAVKTLALSLVWSSVFLSYLSLKEAGQRAKAFRNVDSITWHMDKRAASVLPGLVDVLGAGTCGAETGAAAHLCEAPWCVFFVPHHAGLCSCSQRTPLLCRLYGLLLFFCMKEGG